MVTAGHLSTCPRMLKAADTFANAGYDVRMISTRHVPWAVAADAEARSARNWEWTVVDYARDSNRVTYLQSGLRYHVARMLSNAIGPARTPLRLATRGYSRVHPELIRAARAEPADLFYGGTTGALAAVAMAGRRAGVPYALDLEDFHSAEQDDSPDGDLSHRLAERIERDVLPGAAFLTAASPGIAEAYERRYGVQPIVVNNTFPLPQTEPDLTPGPGYKLRLYWFSQTIGPRRGLEDVVLAMGKADVTGELHLRGNPSNGYLENLQHLAAENSPRLKIVHHEPASPDAMVELSRGYDAGLALEQGRVFNNAICLSNKIFTYMLAGLAMIFTDTPGQRPLAMELGNAALLYQPGDVGTLAAGLKRWAENKELLGVAKTAAWEAAKRRWHWEHVEERGALLKAVARVWQ